MKRAARHLLDLVAIAGLAAIFIWFGHRVGYERGWNNAMRVADIIADMRVARACGSPSAWHVSQTPKGSGK